MTMTAPDPHIQALRDARIAEREGRIAEVQRWADEAAAAGDEDNHHRNLEQVARLKAMRYPWEQSAA
jgi:hypothetical protein